MESGDTTAYNVWKVASDRRNVAINDQKRKMDNAGSIHTYQCLINIVTVCLVEREYRLPFWSLIGRRPSSRSDSSYRVVVEFQSRPQPYILAMTTQMGLNRMEIVGLRLA